MRMNNKPWASLYRETSEPCPSSWLPANMARNADTAYLRQFGSPKSIASFRRQVPTCDYEDLRPYLERICNGESDVLFQGRPVAYERTGGSQSGAKLIPYSDAGLLDFQRCIVPWLARTVQENDITGRAYFSISPATRPPEFVGEVPVGLSDAAYLGMNAGSILATQTAVPLTLADEPDMKRWRQQTITHLMAASDLELISVWSPTFLLRLLEDIPDTQRHWPRLKVVSCWASGSAARYIPQLRQRLPHALIQPKGLLMTEAVITVPGDDDKPVLVRHGFVEFARGDTLLLEDELEAGCEYEVVVTTASGLYRYRTGDRVRFDGRTLSGRSVLEFIGRDSLTSDLAGEKLTEAFVGRCLTVIPGFAMLLPDASHPGYVLICEQAPGNELLNLFESRLSANPQYAYARKLEQLAPLRAVVRSQAFSLVERVMLDRGTRLADVKPVALRTEPFWLPLFEGEHT